MFYFHAHASALYSAMHFWQCHGNLNSLGWKTDGVNIVSKKRWKPPIPAIISRRRIVGQLISITQEGYVRFHHRHRLHQVPPLCPSKQESPIMAEEKGRVFNVFMPRLTLSNPNLPLSSSSTTSRGLLSQFPTCSEWRWFEVLYGKWKNICRCY